MSAEKITDDQLRAYVNAALSGHSITFGYWTLLTLRSNANILVLRRQRDVVSPRQTDILFIDHTRRQLLPQNGLGEAEMKMMNRICAVLDMGTPFRLGPQIVVTK